MCWPTCTAPPWPAALRRPGRPPHESQSLVLPARLSGAAAGNFAHRYIIADYIGRARGARPRGHGELLKMLRSLPSLSLGALDGRKWTKGGCSFPFCPRSFDRALMDSGSLGSTRVQVRVCVWSASVARRGPLHGPVGRGQTSLAGAQSHGGNPHFRVLGQSDDLCMSKGLLFPTAYRTLHISKLLVFRIL